jgi:hypothetical protein
MECNICVYRDRNYNNNCSLLKNRDVPWDCTMIDEEYVKMLNEQIEYYTEKHDKAKDNLHQRIYNQQINNCKELLKKALKRMKKDV